jgi:hypothetical protein
MNCILNFPLQEATEIFNTDSEQTFRIQQLVSGDEEEMAKEKNPQTLLEGKSILI